MARAMTQGLHCHNGVIIYPQANDTHQSRVEPVVLVTRTSSRGLEAATARVLVLEDPALFILEGKGGPGRSRTPSNVSGDESSTPGSHVNRICSGCSKGIQRDNFPSRCWDQQRWAYISSGIGIHEIRGGDACTCTTNHVGHLLFTSLIMCKFVAASRKAKWAGTDRTLLEPVIQTRVPTNAVDQKEETRTTAKPQLSMQTSHAYTNSSSSPSVRLPQM